MRILKIAIVVSHLFIISPSSEAKRFSVGNSSLNFPANLFVLGARRSGEFKLLLDVKTFYGSAMSKDGSSIPSISMNGFGGEVGLGYRLSLLTLGGSYSYLKWKQFTDPVEVENFNVQGTMSTVSIYAGLDFVYWNLLYKYHYMSDYTFDFASSSGQNNSYNSPESSYSIVVNYKLSLNTSINFEYMTMTYSKGETGSGEQVLSDSEALKFNSYFIGYGLNF